jgi:hypothetical protein
MARSKPPKKRPPSISKPPETDDLDLAWSDDAFAGKQKPPTSPKPLKPAPANPAPPPAPKPAAAAAEPDWSEDEFFGTAKKAEPAPAAAPPAAAPLAAAEPDWSEDEFFGTTKKAEPVPAAPAPAPAVAAAEPDWSEDEFFGTTKKAEPAPAAAPPAAAPEPAAQAAPTKNAATLAFSSAAGNALELASVRAASVPPVPTSSKSLSEIRHRVEVGDCSGALLMAEAILETEPDNAEALRYAEQCQGVLQKMYVSRLGGLNRVPQVVTSAEQMRWLSLDHRAGFMISLIDGTCTFDEILDMSGMRRLDALRILFDLLQQNVIATA